MSIRPCGIYHLFGWIARDANHLNLIFAGLSSLGTSLDFFCQVHNSQQEDVDGQASPRCATTGSEQVQQKRLLNEFVGECEQLVRYCET